MDDEIKKENNSTPSENEIGDNNNIYDNNNAEGADDNKNIENGKESEEEMFRGGSKEELANEGKGDSPEEETESACAQGQDDPSESGTSAGEGETADEKVLNSNEYVWNPTAGNSTYHFRPDNMKEYTGVNRSGEYYRTNGNNTATSDATQTDSDGKKEKDAKKKRKKKVATVLAIVLACVIGVVLIGALGAFAFNRLYPYFAGDGASDKTTINMTKNDGSIEVKTNIGSTGYSDLSRADVISLVKDSVVVVTTSTARTDSFFGQYVTSGAGSGIIAAQGGDYAYIVTNYHVVDGADKINITLADSTEYDATYIDGESSLDLAVLRIKTDKTLKPVVYGSSASLRVGDDVIAIGNPLGQLGGTVTEGIISALDRKISIDGNTMVLLQTSAAVNPGNSGGGLFNMAGELVGIVNAKKSSEGIEGLGFAIPIDRVYDSIVEIIEKGYIHGRATLGVETEYVSDWRNAYLIYGVKGTGVFVTNSSNSVLKKKDLILKVGEQSITNASDFAAAVSALDVGQTVRVTISRNGNNLEIDVPVEEYVPSGMFG